MMIEEIMEVGMMTEETKRERPEEGQIYKSKAVDVREGLGVICEFLPGERGLLHISQISWERVETVGDIFSEGDEIEVKLMEIRRDGKFRLSRKVLLEKPEGYVEPERRPRRDDNRGGGGYGGGGGYRGGGDRRDDRRNNGNRYDDRRN